ncbi:MAG: hypothetical protein LQ352_006985 [Teloschistes flavicans]|nr:MAG: hypothetical protein LQ352_006985 [Teloschistes flavicans]
MEQDAISDYGSDFTPDEEELLYSLLQQKPDLSAQKEVLVLGGIEDHEGPSGAKIPRMLYQRRQSAGSASTPQQPTSHVAVEMADNSINPPNVENPESRSERERHERSVSIEAPVDLPQVSVEQPAEPDRRSPLERFRTKPQKALSVTDLVSPSWCELQYWFVLTKHGKKRRTPAMKRGSAVHKTLEDEVHRTIVVDIQTKEDAWGLRIWNIIQGLRTLRETGMTRELEVWGVFDGQVVNGVIDELSYACPDPELETSENNSKNHPKEPPPPLAPDQKSITDFLSPNGSQELSQSNFGAAAAAAAPNIPPTSPTSKASVPRIYITDTKTRSTASVPKGASFRPTLMQLMLYHRLLSNMATGAIDPAIVFERYDLNADTPFTDRFIAQISEIYNDVPTPSSTTDSPAPSLPSLTPDGGEGGWDDTVSLLLAHNSLGQLWSLMQLAFRQTFPAGAASVGNVLQTVYRHASTGAIMSTKCVRHDDGALDEYVAREMRWWKGEREAVGVCLEEAYKCGGCEFADECGWRKGKIEEAREKVRMNRERQKSKV